MNRHALERFLFDFDKSAALQSALRDNPEATFQGYELTAEEKAAIFAKDVATLYQWGVHPLLVRNFAGTVGVRYVAEYARRGLKP
ncbi:MAG: hypothetical protein KAF64_08130 [Hydrogenophaga sp.]|jgi:hypothetical protein|uniref:hypothetical protein n=1 Tax=Hydrogenophaga sp. TaxID=1904254 RepID=UPI0025BA894F|nr:hypothetical protein [Hydrogenophaga sp.]MBU7573305.1 hypothetical protein [Hydrogenophaga sp.]